MAMSCDLSFALRKAERWVLQNLPMARDFTVRLELDGFVSLPAYRKLVPCTSTWPVSQPDTASIVDQQIEDRGIHLLKRQSNHPVLKILATVRLTVFRNNRVITSMHFHTIVYRVLGDEGPKGQLDGGRPEEPPPRRRRIESETTANPSHLHSFLCNAIATTPENYANRVSCESFRQEMTDMQYYAHISRFSWSDQLDILTRTLDAATPFSLIDFRGFLSDTVLKERRSVLATKTAEHRRYKHRKLRAEMSLRFLNSQKQKAIGRESASWVASINNNIGLTRKWSENEGNHRNLTGKSVEAITRVARTFECMVSPIPSRSPLWAVSLHQCRIRSQSATGAWQLSHYLSVMVLERGGIRTQ